MSWPKRTTRLKAISSTGGNDALSASDLLGLIADEPSGACLVGQVCGSVRFDLIVDDSHEGGAGALSSFLGGGSVGH